MDKSTANVRNVKPSFFMGESMTRCEQLEKKIELCMKCARETTGFMRAVWRTHAERLKIKLESLSLKERCEEVK